jgi:hypothetical protein
MPILPLHRIGANTIRSALAVIRSTTPLRDCWTIVVSWAKQCDSELRYLAKRINNSAFMRSLLSMGILLILKR